MAAVAASVFPQKHSCPYSTPKYSYAAQKEAQLSRSTEAPWAYAPVRERLSRESVRQPRYLKAPTEAFLDGAGGEC